MFPSNFSSNVSFFIPNHHLPAHPHVEQPNVVEQPKVVVEQPKVVVEQQPNVVEQPNVVVEQPKVVKQHKVVKQPSRLMFNGKYV